MPITLMKGNTMPMTEADKAKAKIDDNISTTLLDKVQAGLDVINGETTDDDDGGDDNDTKVVDSNDDSEQADDDKSDDDSTPGDVADDSTVDDDSTPESKDTDETGVTDDTKNETTEEVLLPDAYYRAAVHQGWKPDEIKEFFEANPEKALTTLAKIHESTNKLSSEFARLGQVSLKSADKTAEPGTATEAVAAKDVDIAAIKEQYGDDSAVVKAFEVMQAKLDSVSTLPAQPAQNAQQTLPQNDPMRTAVNKFFIDSALKPYEDFYGAGKDAAKLTQEQTGHRWSMLEMADNIILGSQAQGRAITVEEAMDKAHLLVSEPVREKALRTELSAKVKKRAKGVTLKPAKSKVAKKATDGKLSAEQMEAKVAAGLKHVFRKK